MIYYFTYDWLDVTESWGVVQVYWFDTSNPLSVVKYLVLFVVVVARLHQCVEDDVAVKVDNRDSG